MKRFWFLFIILFVLFSCSKSEKKKESITIGVDHVPTEINPLTTGSSISANLLELVFDTLVTNDESGNLIPCLAKSWEVTDNNLTWMMHLREDAFFHDGRKVSASDVKFSYDYVKNQKQVGHATYLNAIHEVKVIDDQTLTITLNYYDNDILFVFSNISIAPKYLLENVSDFSEFNKHPIGSGPYIFVSQDKNLIILRKNDRYFEPIASLDRIEIKVYADQKSVLNRLISGEIDMTFLTNPEDYGALSKIPTVRLYDNWYPRIYLLGFNHKDPLFEKASVKRAINLAIDKEKIIRDIVLNKAFLAKGTLVPETEDYEKKEAHDLLSFNPQESLKILRSEGWRESPRDLTLMKDGKKFEFTTTVFEGENLALGVLRNIQKQLLELGIVMKIEALPLDQWIKKVIREENFQTYIVNLVARPFFNNDFSFWHSSQIKGGLNFSSYQDKTVDHLLEKIRLEVDPEKRSVVGFDLQHQFLKNPPGVFLFWRKMPIAVNSRFYNIPEKRMQHLRDIIYFKVH